MANPLTDAIKYKKSTGAQNRGTPMPNYESGNHHGILAFHHSKVPNLGNAKPGDKITIQAHGSIHSVDPNGHMIMHVHDVKPDSQMMEKSQFPEAKVPVRGVESRGS